MLLRRVDVLPHGLINAPDVFGPDGDGVVAYAAWVRERVLAHGPEGYEPILHLDVYGLGGRQLGPGLGPLVRFCRRVAEAAAPFALQLESPLYGASTARDHRAAGRPARRAARARACRSRWWPTSSATRSTTCGPSPRPAPAT